MSIDANKFTETVTYLHMLWSAPFQITVAMWLLHDLMGDSVFWGFAVMLLMIPLNFVIAYYQKKLTVVTMKVKDKRIKMMGEVLVGANVELTRATCLVSADSFQQCAPPPAARALAAIRRHLSVPRATTPNCTWRGV
jgi:hypothetical protein